MKSKVLLILHIPPPVNGAAMVGKYIMDSQSINETFDADYINLTTSFDLGSIGKGSIGKIFTTMKVILRTAKALLKTNYDLCYVTLTAKGAGFYKDFLIVCLLKLFRKKIIFHFHNKGIKESKSNFIKNGLYRLTFENTQSILLAPQLYSDVSDYVHKENVYFCPNGIPDIEQDSPSSSRDITGDPVCRFLFLSNMMRQKGVFVLLEACALLDGMGLPFECHFVGAWSDISETEFNRAVSEKGLKGKVIAHGPKYGGEKIRFFKESDVFVFPTFYHNEAFPLVNLEAMQQGLPIISTPEGGIPEMILDGQTGFLTNQGNVSELAEKMIFLINSPGSRVAMGMAGRRLYEKCFTLSNFEHNMKTILVKAMIVEPT
ncbi:glycosyltransferase family 4 protein [Flavobacteriaceae bacterium TP-CH-4]|uniref:Glycosyltransferase family 4 protein n=1 Tax=Pelagihabitans pacificus TaxID=2696054 RepID=A0A967AWC2_9FLAO|nr:glycosyltransferase family 4 protein [Pelagihabitans pacificus]